MDNKTASALKITAAIILAIGIVLLLAWWPIWYIVIPALTACFLLLYGLGELIQIAAENGETLRHIEQLMTREEEKAKEENTDVEDEVCRANILEPVPEYIVTPEVLLDGNIKCPMCGSIQPEENKICYHCGAGFELD